MSLDGHLSRPAVADRLKPPPENGRASLMFSHGVAPDRVYSGHVSPRAGCALTAPFHHLLAEIALPRAPLRPPSGADFARRSPTRPACAGLVWGPQVYEEVYFCCTCPRVAPGGCYPLSLPCGARTFLTGRLSAFPRGCPAYSPLYFTAGEAICQTDGANFH